MTTLEEFEAKLEGMPVTTIVGKPTMKSFERLVAELKPIARKLKTNLFQKGLKYGFLCVLCSDEDYGTIISDHSFRFHEPEEPEDYDPAITDSMSDAQRREREEQHKKYAIAIEHTKYLAVTNVLRNKLIAAIEDEYLEKLKDSEVDYDEVHPYDMLEHVKSKVALTTREKREILDLMNIKWDQTITLQKFVNTLNDNRKICKRWNIVTLDQDILQHFVEQIYANNVFDMKVMNEWENKRTALKTRPNAQDYFLKRRLTTSLSGIKPPPSKLAFTAQQMSRKRRKIQQK